MTAEDNRQPGTRCPVCGQAFLRSETRDETFEFEAEAAKVSVEANGVPIEKCPACGEVFTGPEAWRIRDEARCRALGLLLPSEIRALRERLKLSLAELAGLTGIEEQLLADLESGRQIQSRAIDRYLRLLDKDPTALTRLATVP